MLDIATPKAHGHRSGGTVPDWPAINPYHREDCLGRRGHERFAGRMGVLNRERAFFEFPSPVGKNFD